MDQGFSLSSDRETPEWVVAGKLMLPEQSPPLAPSFFVSISLSAPSAVLTPSLTWSRFHGSKGDFPVVMAAITHPFLPLFYRIRVSDPPPPRCRFSPSPTRRFLIFIFLCRCQHHGRSSRSNFRLPFCLKILPRVLSLHIYKTYFLSWIFAVLPSPFQSIPPCLLAAHG